MTLHFFGAPVRGTPAEPERVGLKGAGLLRMASLGMPVPAGVIVDVEACASGVVDDATVEQVHAWSRGLPGIPVVSVRSSGTVSTPGLMDTLLNVGLTRAVVDGAAEPLKHALADGYRRLLAGFGSVVFGMRATVRGALDPLRAIVDRACDDGGVEFAGGLSTERLLTLSDELKAAMAARNHVFPDEPKAQLRLAMNAVLASAHNARMTEWQRDRGSAPTGTALIVQRMALGNSGATSGTGVAISRHPTTGERKLYGEFLVDAQGEELLGGLRSPSPLGGGRAGQKTLESVMPAVFTQLAELTRTLETTLADVQEVEFTVENGMLWLLQTRPARRSAKAAVRIAVELVGEGMWSRSVALGKVDPPSLGQLLAPQVKAGAARNAIARGVPASVGVASGRVVLSSEEAQAWRARGVDTILVRTEARADDLPGMAAAAGVVTSRGGTTSHAAVVCRGMGKCCVVGCPDIRVDEAQRQFTTRSGQTVREGETITVDGHSGEILVGPVELEVQPALPELTTLLKWADEARSLRVLADVDNPGDAGLVTQFGADGFGCLRVASGAQMQQMLDVTAGKAWLRVESAAEAVKLASIVTGELAVVLPVENAEQMRKAAKEIRGALGERTIRIGAAVTTETAAAHGAEIGKHADALVVDARVLGALAWPELPCVVGLTGELASSADVLAKVHSRVAWVGVPVRKVAAARLAAAQVAAVTTENR